MRIGSSKRRSCQGCGVPSMRYPRRACPDCGRKCCYRCRTSCCEPAKLRAERARLREERKMAKVAEALRGLCPSCKGNPDADCICKGP